MKLILRVVAAAIFVCMIVVTVRSTLAMTIPAAWADYAANPWAVATLWDAYSGFTLFFCWVCYKERTFGSRVLWFLLIMGLGNIATSGYLLLQLFRLREEQSVEALLLR